MPQHLLDRLLIEEVGVVLNSSSELIILIRHC